MDTELRDLERALALNPDDLRLRERIARFRQREENASFEAEVMSALVHYQVNDCLPALTIAKLVFDAPTKNNGVPFPLLPKGHDATLYASVSARWESIEAFYEHKQPAKYLVSFHERVRANGVVELRDRMDLPPFPADEVRAWAAKVRLDDGKRVERWLEALQRMRTQHVMVYDANDVIPNA